MGAVSWRAVFHAVTLAYYGYVDYKMVKSMEGVHTTLGRPIDDPALNRWINGSFIYFTFWNLIMQEIYFAICCLEHFSNMFPKTLPMKSLAKVQKTRQAILTSVFIPSAFLVTVNYLVMVSIVPNLVFGEFLEVFPSWVNHSFHTYVVPVAVLEVYLRASSGEAAEMGSSKGWKILNGYLTIYFVATVISTWLRGTWPYPFLDNMEQWMRVAFMIYVYASAWIWYYACGKITKNLDDKEKSRKRGHPVARRRRNE